MKKGFPYGESTYKGIAPERFETLRGIVFILKSLAFSH